jgi:hypothetical protein
MVLLGDDAQVDACLVCLNIVFAERSIGSEIVLDAPDGSPM